MVPAFIATALSHLGNRYNVGREAMNVNRKTAAPCVSLLLGLLLALVSTPAATAQGRDGSLSLDMDLGRVSPQPAAQPQTKRAEGRGGHRIGQDDTVSVTVLGEEDLTLKDVAVSSDGSIIFPLLGEVKVIGLSARQLEARLTRLLADGYLRRPVVSVAVHTNRIYYIKGEVKNPGGYTYIDGLTVEKAVALAGGYTPRASEEKIVVVREANLDKPLKSVKPSTTVVLPGDVITVGESFF